MTIVRVPFPFFLTALEGGWLTLVRRLTLIRRLRPRPFVVLRIVGAHISDRGLALDRVCGNILKVASMKQSFFGELAVPEVCI